MQEVVIFIALNGSCKSKRRDNKNKLKSGRNHLSNCTADSQQCFPLKRPSKELALQRKYKNGANKDINYDVIKMLVSCEHIFLRCENLDLWIAIDFFSMSTCVQNLAPACNSIAIVKAFPLSVIFMSHFAAATRTRLKMLHFTRLIKFLVKLDKLKHISLDRPSNKFNTLHLTSFYTQFTCN